MLHAHSFSIAFFSHRIAHVRHIQGPSRNLCRQFQVIGYRELGGGSARFLEAYGWYRRSECFMTWDLFFALKKGIIFEAKVQGVG